MAHQSLKAFSTSLPLSLPFSKYLNWNSCNFLFNLPLYPSWRCSESTEWLQQVSWAALGHNYEWTMKLLNIFSKCVIKKYTYWYISGAIYQAIFACWSIFSLRHRFHGSRWAGLKLPLKTEHDGFCTEIACRETCSLCGLLEEPSQKLCRDINKSGLSAATWTPLRPRTQKLWDNHKTLMGPD